jgi:AcrR family transcriptional regulator
MIKRTDTFRRTDRRQALIHAAYSAIAAKGFEGLRLRDVAAAAGIDHSTLHHHFRTKRDLIAAVVDYATEQFRPPSGPGVQSVSTLREHLRFLSRMIAQRPDLHVVLRELDLRSIRDTDTRAIIAERESGWRSRLAARIRTAAQEGAWPSDLGAAAGAELVIAVVKGASLNPQHATKVLNLFQKVISRAPRDHETSSRRKRS